MVVYNFNRRWAVFSPSEANAVLLVDPDAVESLPITFQSLQLVSRWHSQRIKARNEVNLI
jgi:hypothetical protein